MDVIQSSKAPQLKATARQRGKKRRENRNELVTNGWPERTDNQRHFWLKPYGRMYTAFVKGKGFCMHLEGDKRVAFGCGYNAALKGLIRLLEPDVESIEFVGGC
jgi:hypothetical protein